MAHETDDDKAVDPSANDYKKKLNSLRERVDHSFLDAPRIPDGPTTLYVSERVAHSIGRVPSGRLSNRVMQLIIRYNAMVQEDYEYVTSRFDVNEITWLSYLLLEYPKLGDDPATMFRLVIENTADKAERRGVDWRQILDKYRYLEPPKAYALIAACEAYPRVFQVIQFIHHHFSAHLSPETMSLFEAFSKTQDADTRDGHKKFRKQLLSGKTDPAASDSERKSAPLADITEIELVGLLDYYRIKETEAHANSHEGEPFHIVNGAG